MYQIDCELKGYDDNLTVAASSDKAGLKWLLGSEAVILMSTLQGRKTSELQYSKVSLTMNLVVWWLKSITGDFTQWGTYTMHQQLQPNNKSGWVIQVESLPTGTIK